MSDLIVIGYPDEKAAQDVWEELVKLATYDKFVEGAAALRRDNPANLAVPRVGAAAHEDPARGGPEGTDLGAANGLTRSAGLSDLIAALAPRAVTLPGRVMWFPHRKQQSGNEANKRAGEVDR
jgi:hypothetical protein